MVDAWFEAVTLSGTKEVPVLLDSFMSAIDMGNRWTYKGSLTTPPCTVGVYWNVVHRVFKISPATLNWFKATMTNGADIGFKKDGLGKIIKPTNIYGTSSGETFAAIGNYRVLNKVDKHDVRFVETTFDASHGNNGLKSAVSIFTVVSVVLLMVLVYCAVWW